MKNKPVKHLKYANIHLCDLFESFALSCWSYNVTGPKNNSTKIKILKIIRKLFFGGTDSVAGVITTVVVEEVMKAGINSAINKMNDKNERRR